MTNYLKVDDRNKRLVMDRTFDKNRRIVGSDEYDKLQRAKADYPLYTVVLRKIKKNPNKESYGGMDYTYMEGYSRAMAEKGLKENVIPVSSIDYDGARDAVQKCIESGRVPRVFACPNDMMALGAINTLRSAGISVPEQCAVTGFDNVIFSEISSVPITTVNQDIKMIAKKSTDIILEMIDGKELEKTYCLIGTEIVKRSSC